MTGNDRSASAAEISGISSPGYEALAGLFDEMQERPGAPRGHWQKMLAALGQLGMEGLTRRWQEARQLIRENGVTYNVHGDPRGLDRPWHLDPIPLLISPSEGAFLEAGLIQRAQLLERILADVYGPRDLLARGLLPVELVYGNPAFLRPCHGLPAPANRHLTFYA